MAPAANPRQAEALRREAEALRQVGARKAVAGRGDPLLMYGSNVIAKGMFPKADAKEKQRAVMFGLLLTLGGFTVYIIQLIAWYNLYQHSFVGTIAIIVVFLLASVISAAFAGQKREWLFYLGVLCGLGVLFGTLVGFYAYYSNLVYYVKWKDRHTYTNVGASQSPKTFADAAMFLWSEDTRIDPLRSVGFKSRYTGDTYCVAPIIDSTQGEGGSELSYFAIGENCCSARAQFSCDDARELGTRSSLVVLEPDEIVRPYMKWAVAASTYPRYERALKLLEATYNTKLGEKVMLVRWTKDPIGMRDDAHHRALRTTIGLSIAYFFVSAALSAYIAFISRPSKKMRDNQPTLRA